MRTAAGRSRGKLAEHGDYEEEADTERPVVTFGGRIVTDDHPLPPGPLLQSTEAWYVRPITSHRWQVDLDLNPEDGFTTTTIAEHPPLLALIATLRAARVSGAEIPTPHDVLNTSQLQARNYTITLSDGSTATFLVSSSGRVVDAGIVEQWSYVFEMVPATETYDTDLLDEWLNTNEVSIGTTMSVIKSPIGQYTQPLFGSEVDFGDGNKISFSAGSRISHVKKGAIVRRVAEGNNLVLSYADLATVNGVKTLPTPAEFPSHNTLHIEGLTANTIIRSRDPAEMCGFVLNERPFLIHNRDATHTAEIQTWAGANVVTLRPNEVLEMLYFFNENGGGELIAIIPERFAIGARGEDGTLASPGFYEYDSTFWARPLVAPTVAQHSRFDADAFRIGTATWANGAALNAANLAASQYTLEALKDGVFRFRKTIGVSVQSSGTFPASHFIRLYILRDGAFLTTPDIHQNALTGTDTFRRYVFDHLYAAEAGDLLAPFLMYPKSNNLNPSGLRVDDHDVDLALQSRMVFTHTT